MTEFIHPERQAELELLARFPLASRQQGIKLHRDAAPDLLAAAQRLHASGMISSPDGGYLTDAGFHLAQALQGVLSVLSRPAGVRPPSHELIE